VTYTINGKQYTQSDINERCARIDPYVYKVHGPYPSISESAVHIEGRHGKYGNLYEVGFDPCNDWNDAGPIIEKCFDELMAAPCFFKGLCMTKWECIIDEWECTKLIAACICLIELNE
tara:strand:+ start:1561 stop:1914 length:354 start_codon:yes stop_codon:yes gene_type:complete